jgi:hypothetical protein
VTEKYKTIETEKELWWRRHMTRTGNSSDKKRGRTSFGWPKRSGRVSGKLGRRMEKGQDGLVVLQGEGDQCYGVEWRGVEGHQGCEGEEQEEWLVLLNWGFLSCLIKSGIRLVFGVSAEICSREILLYKGFLSSLFGTELAPSVK